jgi:hypothetical protein
MIILLKKSLSKIVEGIAPYLMKNLREIKRKIPVFLMRRVLEKIPT